MGDLILDGPGKLPVWEYLITLDLGICEFKCLMAMAASYQGFRPPKLYPDTRIIQPSCALGARS